MVSYIVKIAADYGLIDKYSFAGGLDANGDPIVVEIDESKFGKRKYHSGHRVEGVWVVGGVEKTNDRKLFLITVPRRTEEVLMHIIKTFVKPGTLIHTDGWRAYRAISRQVGNQGESLGYQHQVVNHSEGFRASDGTHTNTIEGKSF